jgi:hypothetical protein
VHSGDSIGDPHTTSEILTPREGIQCSSMRKDILAKAIVLALATFSVGCQTSRGCDTSRIQVIGQAYKEFYSPISSGYVSHLAYRVDVTVKNIGREPVVYDTAYGIVIPSQGKPLLLPTYVYDKAKGSESDAYKGHLKTAALKPGESQAFSYSTDGYTQDLEQHANGIPLQFVFELLVGDTKPATSLIGSHRGDLPSLSDLPDYSAEGPTSGKDLVLRCSN